MKLSIIMPVYNERKTIIEILRKVLDVDLSEIGFTKEIIVIDDGSTDGTREILKTASGYQVPDPSVNQIKTIYHEKNQGKGVAVRTGLKYVTGDIVLIQDADLEYDPNDYVELIKPIVEKKSKIVYGSRTLGKNKKSYWSYYLGGRMLSFFTNLLYGSHLTDEATCYKVFSSDVIRDTRLTCRKFEFCPEVTAKALKRGYKILEIPIHYYPRHIREGKKIRFSDALEAFWVLIKYRIT